MLAVSECKKGSGSHDMYVLFSSDMSLATMFLLGPTSDIIYEHNRLSLHHMPGSTCVRLYDVPRWDILYILRNASYSKNHIIPFHRALHIGHIVMSTLSIHSTIYGACSHICPLFS